MLTLVTGAAGFTGRHVVEQLAGRGHEVHAVVHEPPADPISGAAQVHQGDITDLPATERILAAILPDHVIHLAAIANVAHNDSARMYATNVIGTRQLLEALAQLQRVPKSVLLASSANVYGNAHCGMIDESMAPAPANDYGVSKLAMEQVARLYGERLPLIVVRPFNYTGVGQSPEFLIPKIVAHARRRADVIELGNLNVARDFSDVRAVADAYCRLIDFPGAIGETYNVCSGLATTLQEVIETVIALTGHNMAVRTNPAFVRSDEVRTLWGSAAKLEQKIGPLRSIPFRDTLSWMLGS